MSEHKLNLKDGEEIKNQGFCGRCNKETTTINKRDGRKLLIYCGECGLSYGGDEYRFMSEEEKKTEQTWMNGFGLSASDRKKFWDSLHRGT